MLFVTSFVLKTINIFIRLSFGIKKESLICKFVYDKQYVICTFVYVKQTIIAGIKKSFVFITATDSAILVVKYKTVPLYSTANNNFSFNRFNLDATT